jgi:hypothetical protein
MNRSRWTWLRLILLGLAFAAGTYAVGWWAVPAIGALWGLMNPAGRRVALRSGGAAALAWAALLLVPAAVGAPVPSFGAALAASMQMPTWVLTVVELLFPFALGWAAATLGAEAFARRARGVHRTNAARAPDPDQPSPGQA